MREFDLLGGGIEEFNAYLEELKNGIEKSTNDIVDEISKDIKENIKKNAQGIDSSFAYSSKEREEISHLVNDIINANTLDKISSTHAVLRSTKESVTYSEFGTGVVGKSNPYVLNELQWEYDVNNHGEKDIQPGVWRFTSKYGIGSGIATRGVPAWAVYWHSFDESANNMYKTADKVIKKNLKIK